MRAARLWPTLPPGLRSRHRQHPPGPARSRSVPLLSLPRRLAGLRTSPEITSALFDM